ncbi:MAG: hypothetical protein M3458_05340 [Acidobacteriota bacterium]|nr:hypothetical protein [Acidobacteriota bacterium]
MAVHLLELSITGALNSVAQGLRYIRVPLTGTITRVDLYSATPNAAAGQAVFDVNLNTGAGGALVSIFALPADRPRILQNATTGFVSGLSVACVKGQILTVDLDEFPPGGVVTPAFVLVEIDDGTGAGAGLTEEQVDDRVVALIVPGVGLIETYDDAANSLKLTPALIAHNGYVTWRNQYHLGDATGIGATGANGLIYCSQSYWFYGGADSTQLVYPGQDIDLTMRPSHAAAGANIGLGTADLPIDATIAEIELCWHTSYDGNCRVYESGVLKHAAGTYTTATVLRIKVTAAGGVEYYKDGVLVYTSLILPATVAAWALRVNAVLGFYGGNIPPDASTNNTGAGWSNVLLVVGTPPAAAVAPATPAARVYRSTDQSIPNAVYTSLALSSERFDTDAIHDNVTNNSRLTCKTAGLYQISFAAVYDTNTTGERYLRVLLNNATIIATQSNRQSIAGDAIVAGPTLYQLAVNDYIELQAYQSSGAALLVKAYANYSPEFMMVKVG